MAKLVLSQGFPRSSAVQRAGFLVLQAISIPMAHWHRFCAWPAVSQPEQETSPMARRATRRFFGIRRFAVALCAVGVLPGMGAQALAAGKVYVSSEKDHKVYVFNAAGERQGAIEVCKRPRDMAFNADGSLIYVICGDSNALGVVDVAAGKLTTTVPLGESPEMFDLSPDGKTAYVSIEDDSVMAAYDITSKKPLFEVKTGGEPEGVLITPDGKTAYVTSEVANVVHVIDLAQRKIVKNIKVGQRPRRFVLSADGAELWVSNELDATVSVVDTRTHTEKQKVRFEVKGMRPTDITPVGMALSPDGQRLWVGLGRANHVAEVDVASKAVKQLVLVGKRAWGLGFAPDGKTLYVANGLSDDMTIIDTAAGRAIKSVPAGRVPHTILVK
jgi:PQQ-dependent catabolism-associated beta-propeller protein